GQMISSADAAEAVVNEAFTHAFGFEKPADAIGKTLEFLAPSKPGDRSASTDESEKDASDGKDSGQDSDAELPSFFGLPLNDETSSPTGKDLVARTFRIVGVLNTEVKDGAGQGGVRGLFPGARVYIPLPAARQWASEHRGPMNQVALALARESGALGDSEY